MNTQVLSVYDQKAKAFMTPFFCTNVAVGIRAFTAACNTKGTPIGDHPADFTLYHLGTFDDEKAEFDLFDLRRNLGDGPLFVKNEKG